MFVASFFVSDIKTIRVRMMPQYQIQQEWLHTDTYLSKKGTERGYTSSRLISDWTY